MENNQQIKQLNKSDLKQIYTYMLADFPDNERKPLKMIEDSFDSGFMEGYGFYSKDDILLAYAIFVKIDDILLLDYFAVVKESRGKGLGSAFLGQLQKKLSGYECVIFEVENPDFCEDEEERKIMEKRIGFYLKNGVRDTGACGRVYEVEYRFFEFEGMIRHTKEEALERIGRFYHTYWQKETEYNKYVQMHK